MKKPDVNTQAGGSIEHTKSRGGNQDRDLPVKVYTSDSLLRSPIDLFATMLRDLLSSRELAWRLFVRDTRARYRQSLLGYFWVFVPPLLAAVPFIFLNSQGVIEIGDTPIPYGAFAMIGTMLWQIFVDALISPLQAVQGAISMLTRINFPREGLLLAGLLQVGLAFTIRLPLLALIFIAYGNIPPATIVLFPIGVLSLVITGFAIGLLLTPLGLLYGDVQRALTVITPFWMLLTPVLFPTPQNSLAGAVVSLNPLTSLITVTRDWLTLGVTSDLTGFIVITVLMLVLLVAAWTAYCVTLPHLIARLGN
jgi:lipopolysaccharide transport system permease protein